MPIPHQQPLSPPAADHDVRGMLPSVTSTSAPTPWSREYRLRWLLPRCRCPSRAKKRPGVPMLVQTRHACRWCRWRYTLFLLLLLLVHAAAVIAGSQLEFPQTQKSFLAVFQDDFQPSWPGFVNLPVRSPDVVTNESQVTVYWVPVELLDTSCQWRAIGRRPDLVEGFSRPNMGLLAYRWSAVGPELSLDTWNRINAQPTLPRHSLSVGSQPWLLFGWPILAVLLLQYLLLVCILAALARRIVQLARASRYSHRFRRGVCVNCQYPRALRSIRQCPECGLPSI